MAILNNTRKAFGSYFLKKELSNFNRRRKVYNLDNAKTIGITYGAVDQLNYDAVNNLLKDLKNLNKTVKVMGYIPEKKYFQDYYLKLEFDFFTWKDTNWYLKPTKPNVIDFIDTNFDILIDLSMQDHFPLQYIANVSKAKFKVGRSTNEKLSPYDMIIHTEKLKSLDEYIENDKLYLSKINKVE